MANILYQIPTEQGGTHQGRPALVHTQHSPGEAPGRLASDLALTGIHATTPHDDNTSFWARQYILLSAMVDPSKRSNLDRECPCSQKSYFPCFQLFQQPIAPQMALGPFHSSPGAALISCDIKL